MKKETHVFTDAADAGAYLCGDPAVADRVRELTAQSHTVLALTSARCRLGLGLDDFAGRMGITVEELTRLEEGTDADLSPNQLTGYVLALLAAAMPEPQPRHSGPKAAARKRTALA